MSIRKVNTKNGEVRWEARLYEAGRGSKRIFRSFERKSDAEAFVHEQKELRKKRIESPFQDVTFKDRYLNAEAEYWLQDARVRFSASHLKRVLGILSEVLPKFGQLPIERFTPEFLSNYQRGEKTKGLSNATANRKTEVITSILNHSTKHRRIPFNPSTGFKKLGSESQEMLFWSESEASDFLKSAANRYPPGSQSRCIYVSYLIALNTALRAGEIWGLKPIDLSDNGRLLQVRRQFNRVTLEFSQPKGKRSRVVPCNESLAHEIRELLKTNRIGPDQTVFQNEKGNPVCHDNFANRQFAKDLRSWGGRSIRFHDLRHTATTLMIANGIDLKTVKEICGHANIQTTMNYVHLVSGSIERVAESFAIRPTQERREDETNATLSLIKRAGNS